MTNHWIDLKNADVIFVIGCNPAENHPISFRWVNHAIENRGAKLIVADPRVTRSASLADLYAPLRSGTDLAFIGGIINYILQNDLIQKEYVVEYTNAAYLINKGFGFHDGLFTGYNGAKRSYDKTTWAYQKDEKGVPLQDKTLSDPFCVYQLMKKHYSRYTPDKVEAITGCPKETFIKVAQMIGETGKQNKVATVMYAMGITQHTVGTQNVRSLAIMQLLLGNIGIAGGGINALRGESNVQGSTDYALLFHQLPGYLPYPTAQAHPTFEKYIASTPKTADPMSINWWSNRPKYLVSLLKAWFGENATKENDFCYDLLPKSSKGQSLIVLFEDMLKGIIKGTFYMGTNPVVGSPNANRIAKAMEQLDWLVAVDLWETDSSVFWKRKGANPETIKTEVFLLPAASSVEKCGSVSNSGRWTQWRYKAVNPPGDALADLDILDLIFRQVRELYKKEGGKCPDAITKAWWNFTPPGHHEPDPQMVAREINGFTFADKKQVKSFTELKDDGSTACGCWIYSGSYPEAGKNLLERRGLNEGPGGIGLYPEWAWCWPSNRRIIYNRAAVKRDGTPWDPTRPVVTWNGEKWLGDVVDGGGTAGPAAKNPFIMNEEGVGRLFSTGVADGPLTEHFEPMESPVYNLLNSQKVNPAAVILDSVAGTFAATGQYPYIGTTYRMVEHWQAGAMTRNLPWLAELVPDMFCEISESLAKTKNIKTGDRVTVFNGRGQVHAYALVSDRIRPINVSGKLVETVGLVWHFGPNGGATGDAANMLTPSIGCANTMIPEYKAFLVDLRKEEA